MGVQPLCVLFNATLVRAPSGLTWNTTIVSLQGLFQSELMKSILHIKARVLLLEYDLYHILPPPQLLIKLFIGFIWNLKVKSVTPIKVYY